MAEELHFTLAQRHAVKNQWRLYKEVARVMNREGIVGIEELHGASRGRFVFRAESDHLKPNAGVGSP